MQKALGQSTCYSAAFAGRSPLIKEIAVPTLRLLDAAPGVAAAGGEILACAYSPDGAFVLSGSADGQLRLWETSQGSLVTTVPAGSKPVTACAVAPDGKSWLSGSLDGLLAHWDPVTHRRSFVFLAHPRPISCIVFSVDGRTLVTAAWEGNISVWDPNRERDGHTLTGHQDIVAGCRLTPVGQSLVSWSYDGSVRLWDLARWVQQKELSGHADRVTAGAVSPDGRWAVTGSRDGAVKLWDLHEHREVASALTGSEVASCLFLLDGETVIVLETSGRAALFTLPDLLEGGEVLTRLRAHCAELSPSSDRIALGCQDGQVRFLAVDDLEASPLVVTATQTSRRESTMLQRFFGKSQLVHSYQCVCPVCRQSVPLANGEFGRSASCSRCHRRLRVGGIRRITQEEEMPVT